MSLKDQVKNSGKLNADLESFEHLIGFAFLAEFDILHLFVCSITQIGVGIKGKLTFQSYHFS